MKTVEGGAAIIEGEEVELWARGLVGILTERFWGAAILGTDAVAALVSEEASP